MRWLLTTTRSRCEEAVASLSSPALRAAKSSKGRSPGRFFVAGYRRFSRFHAFQPKNAAIASPVPPLTVAQSPEEAVRLVLAMIRFHA